MPLFPFNQKQNFTPEDTIVRANYLRLFESKNPGRTPLREISFVVLDTETTGLEIGKDQILSIAGLYLRDLQFDLSNRMELLIQRQNYNPGRSVEVHGIMSHHVAQGVKEREALVQLLNYVKNHIIVGHHISFDIQMINKSLQKHFGLILRNKLIDTGKLAQRVANPMLQEEYSQSLDALCLEYHIPLGQRHTAGGDTFITALLFLKLLGRLESKKVKTLRELM